MQEKMSAFIAQPPP